MDVRIADGLERFCQGQIELFGSPLKNVGSGGQTLGLDKGDSYSFCAFCVYLAINSFNIPVHSYEDAVTEGHSERGFDGIAIALNDIPLESPETAAILANEELSDYVDKMAEGDAGEMPTFRILMVQVKMAHSARMTELDAMGSAAYRFLTLPKYLNEVNPNETVTRWWNIYDAIRRVYQKHGLDFTPELDLLFVYQGDKTEEEPLNKRACETHKEILSTKLGHKKVNFCTWRIDEINEAIALADQSVDGVLKGAKLLPFPENACSGYIGYVPAQSIADMIPKIKIAGDDKELPDERVFADNVRSFTGDHKNPGAIALRNTLSAKQGDQLILRHNGITIVARDASLSGSLPQQAAGGKRQQAAALQAVPQQAAALQAVPQQAAGGKRQQAAALQAGEVDVTLKAYQIVNGAQSSFILQRNMELLAGAYIPIKIVVTDSEEVKNGVVLGANTQAQISPYDMLARFPEIRALQQAFQAVDHQRADKLWFQRRRGERFANRVHHPFQIVTPRQLLEAYVATISGQPHTVHANAGKLLERVSKTVFCSDHHPSVYRAMGWLVVAGRHWAEAANYGWAVEGTPGTLSMNRGRNLYIPQHHFLFALWHLVDPTPDDVDPDQGRLARKSPKVEERFENICKILSDRETAIRLGERAALAVEKAREDGTPIGSQVRKLSFTERLRQTVRQ